MDFGTTVLLKISIDITGGRLIVLLDMVVRSYVGCFLEDSFSIYIIVNWWPCLMILIGIVIHSHGLLISLQITGVFFGYPNYFYISFFISSLVSYFLVIMFLKHNIGIVNLICHSLFLLGVEDSQRLLLFNKLEEHI